MDYTIFSPELTNAVKYLALLVSYAFLGGGLKYIDQVYDVGVHGLFRRHIAYGLTLCCGLLMGFLVAVDAYSSMIFLSIVIAVAVSRKIDNPAFLGGAMLVFLIPLFTHNGGFQWVGFTLLLFSGILDEFLNDFADQHKEGTLVYRLLYYRPAFKVMIVGLAVAGILAPVYLLAFLLFDAAYSLMDSYSSSVLGGRSRLSLLGNGIQAG